MADQQIETSRTDHKPAAEHDTVLLTNDELRSTSGGHGVFLNLEVEKRPKTNDRPRGHGPHREH